MNTTILISVEEAAAALGVSRLRLYELIRRGHMPAVRLGARQLRISRAALAAFIEGGGTRRGAEAVAR